jgi:carboxyl-terminal processing protease
MKRWTHIGGRRLLRSGLCAAALLVAAPGPAAEPPALEKDAFVATGARAARVLSAIIPRAHLFHQPVTDAIAAKALDLYFDALDFDRTFFLASDLEEFRREIPRLARAFRDGDLAIAFRIYDRYQERVRDRLAFVETQLNAGFDLQSTEAYLWRRRNAPRAATPAEWDALWRRKLQHEYVARLVAVQLAAETPEAAAETAVNGSRRRPDAAEAERRQIAGGDGSAGRDAHLTPEEFLRRRYRQFDAMLRTQDAEQVVDRFLSAFTSAFDPHSEYMSPARTEDFDINMKLMLVGIGAQLMPEDGAAKIERVIPGGPADRDGRLQPGDRIIAVGQGDEPPEDILHMPLYRAVRKIRGEKGTPVTLVYWPANDISGSTEHRVTLIREEVKLEEQAAKRRIIELPGDDGRPRKLGLITLPEFYADFRPGPGQEPRRSATDVRRILEELRAEGVEGIALDLRNNGGGSLPDAIEMAGFFIRSGPVVQVRDARQVQVLSDPDPAVVYDGPMVVLINRMSASASEIVAAALQDYGRAILIGDSKTHGKGSVQSLLPLEVRGERLGSFKVTTANFYRISGGSTQVKGVEPDIIVPSVFDGMELGEEFLPNAMPWTMVDPAFYATLVNQAPPVDVLRAQSSRRRAEDEAFQTRASLLERIRARVNAETISLNLEERLAMARADRELDRMQRTLLGGETPEEAAMNLDDAESADTPDAVAEGAVERDPVLMEAMRILGDIVDYQIALKPEVDVAAKP